MNTVSFSRLGNHGRLSNQLFQLCSTIGIAAKNNAQATFPEWSYERYFDIELDHNLMPVCDIVKESRFEYSDINLDGGAFDLSGYFQSEKYFDQSHGRALKFKYQVVIDAMGKLEPGAFDKPTILMHIRRGDYVGNPHYYQLPITYYIGALIQIPGWQECNVIIISDDLPYAKVHFQCLGDNVFFADDLNEVESMALAPMCDHFILSNSTYSWWCAYLGEKVHSQIIHPGHLFRGPSLGANNTKDFWPDRWTRYKLDSYKLDLSKMTFTIPVFHDHRDRKHNLDLSVCMLQSAFHTNIIVMEQGGNKFEYMGQYCQYIKFKNRVFHRTKMLNDMAILATTPYIANWDCDIIIPPMQVYLGVLMLMQGAEMLFPYDGRFARLPREPWFKSIQSTLDIGVVKDDEPKGKRGRAVPVSSVGGAVFFNKASFIDGGMENENMISFGPEDCERNDRFSMLGYRVERIDGCLYHIDHWCGPDSSKRNPYFRANHLELDKIRLMNQQELKAYVQTWMWRPVKVSQEEVDKRLQEVCEWAERQTGTRYQIVSSDMHDLISEFINAPVNSATL
ncbi:MAG: alpha-1,2-fucosyltransferase [Bacteroidota bacterium]